MKDEDDYDDKNMKDQVYIHAGYTVLCCCVVVLYLWCSMHAVYSAF